MHSGAFFIIKKPEKYLPPPLAGLPFGQHGHSGYFAGFGSPPCGREHYSNM
jgi:hypothetical protein